MPDPNPNPDPTPEPTGSPTVKVDHPAPAPAAKADPGLDFTSVIPEAYKDKPYMKEVNSFDKLFKDFDNAQSLIGQRQQEFKIPGPDATPEELEAYVRKVRPETKDVYEFPETEYSKKFGRDEAFQGQMKELFHKAGLHPWQVKTLTEGYDQALFSKANEVANSVEQQNQEFIKLSEGYFGDKAEEKLKIANDILKANTPDAFKDHLEKLDNTSAMIMASVLNNVYEKFMKEDDLNTGAKPSGSDGTALQEEARQLMADPAYKDFRHPRHDATVKRVNELYDQIGKLKS